MYIGIAVEFIIPIVYSLICRFIGRSKRFRGMWIFTLISSIAVWVFSFRNPVIFYQSSGSLSSSGTETIYVAISFIIMAIISHLMSKLNTPQIVNIIIGAIAGSITISFGSWVS